VLALLGALVALPMLVAGAQTNGSTGSNGVAPNPPGACVIDSFTDVTVAAGTQVTITGTAPSSDNTHVILYANGQPAVAQAPGDIVAQDVTDGTFTLKYTVTQTVELSVNFTFGNQNAYTAICSTKGGVLSEVVRVGANEVTRAALAFTGSSDAPSYVLIGIGAIVLGAVLVVAARRRSQVT
jgi:LPXTG-motif cell wall-anchored protein